MFKLLIVDDDKTLCKVLSDELIEIGYKVDFITDSEKVFEYLDSNKIDLLLLDIKMPKVDGYEILSKYPKINRNFKIIVLTANADLKTAVEVSNLGADNVVCKPYDFFEIVEVIKKTLAGIEIINSDRKK